MRLLLATTLAFSAMAGGTAHADEIGSIDVRPGAGADARLFGGIVYDARCPAGTLDSYFDIVGDDIGMGARAGSGDLGFLGQGTKDGRGRQEFSGVSIANLRTTNTGSFAGSGRYRIRFNCIQRSGAALATYERTLIYAAGGAGSFTFAPVPARFRATTSPPPGSAGSGTAGGPAAPSVAPSPVGSNGAAVQGGAGEAGPTGNAAGPDGGGSGPGSERLLVLLLLALAAVAAVLVGRGKPGWRSGTHRA